MNGNNLVCVEDFEEVARQRLSGGIFTYYSKGVKPLEQTLKESRKAFARYRLRPRMLCGPFKKNLSTKVLGQDVDIPIGISPTALHSFAHLQKEKGTAKAAHSHGTLMVLSSIANTHITELHQEASNGLLWMQTYFFKTSALTKAIIRRAERAGFKALVVTIDSSGIQVGQTKSSAATTSLHYLAAHKGVELANLDVIVDENREVYEHIKQEDPSLRNYSIYEVNGSHATLEDIVWLKSFTHLPIVLKGVLSVATARKAVSVGVDGILVSAHGGRQLDGVPASIDVLPEIVEAVKGSGVEVYLDGGIRTGTDVLKALALGARAVFIGRPALWGLAVDGSRGVSKVLQILTEELDLAMTLSGVKDVRNVPRSIITHESEYLASKL